MRGLLGGAIRSETYQAGDLRRTMPRFMEPLLSRNLTLIDRFDALAAKAGTAPAPLALGWVLSRGDHVIAPPGTTNIAHLEENGAALSHVWPADVLDAVTALFPPNALKGPRYSKAAQAQIDTELLPGEELAD